MDGPLKLNKVVVLQFFIINTLDTDSTRVSVARTSNQTIICAFKFQV